MKKILLSVLLLSSIFTYGQQNISLLFGGSLKGNTMYGIECTTKSFGLAIKNYTSEHNYPDYEMPIGRNVYPEPEKIVYDGIMVGVTYNIKEYNNLIMTISGGNISEYRIYRNQDSSNGMVKTKNTAFEVSFGKRGLLNDYITFGANFGMNTTIGLTANVSIGLTW